jgi:hypothetical protein
LGVVHEFAHLERHLAFDEIILGFDRHPLTGCHARRTRHGRCHAGKSNHVSTQATRGKTDDERHIGHKTVTEPEDARTCSAASKTAVVGVIFVLGACEVSGRA